MTQPSVITEVAFTATPFGTLVWTDVSAYVDWRAGSFTTNRGRNDELNTTGAGTAGFTLDNRTGRFDSMNAASPYWPYVKPMTPIRVRATYSATTYNVWRGFVERWPQSWQSGGSYGQVQLVASDGMKTVLGFQFSDRLADVVAAQSPVQTNAAAGHLGAATWTGTGYTFTPVTAFFPDGTTGQAMQITVPSAANTSLPSVGYTGVALVSGGASWSLELWISFDPTTSFTAAGIALPFQFPLVTDANASPGQGEGMVFARAVAASTVGLFVQFGNGNANNYQVDSGVRIACDGTPHAVMIQWDSTSQTHRLYLDGVLKWTSPTKPVSETAQGWGGYHVAELTGDTTSYTTLKFTIDWFSLVPGIVSPSQRYATGSKTQSFAAELTGTRIGHILDAIGWPTADRVLDTGTVTLQASGSLAGNTALSAVQDASKAEGGNVFIDGQGRFVFQDRHHNYTGYTSAATFGETGYPYLGDIQVEFSDDFIYNDVLIQQANSSPAYVASGVDTTSQSEYGIRVFTGTYPLANTADVDAIAATLNAVYSLPRPRIAQVTLEGRAHQANFPQMLGREIGDIVTVIRTPIGAPPISLTCVIQGVAHTIGPTTWQTKFLLSPAPLYSTWIVGDPTYGVVGSTTTVAF